MKVCGCGTCEDAVNRAVGFVCKMIDDDECQMFILAVCVAMTTIGKGIQSNTIEALTAEREFAMLIEFATTHNAMIDEVRKMAALDKHEKQFNEKLEAFFARVAENAKLPKGD